MKYQNLSARGYIVQGAKLFVTEFKHIYIWVGLLFLFVFSFSGGGDQSGFDQLAEKNSEMQLQAFIQGHQSGGVSEGIKRLSIVREKQSKEQADMLLGLVGMKNQLILSGESNNITGTTTGIVGELVEKNDVGDSSMPWGVVGFMAGFVFVFISIFVVIGWRIGLVRGGWFAHIIYNRILNKETSQRGSLLQILNHSLILLKTDAKRLLIGYRPSLVIFVIIMIVGGYGYLQDRSRLVWGVYALGSIFIGFIGIIYGIYISSLKYGFSKIASFVHLDLVTNNYLEHSDGLTRHRRRNLFGNQLLLGAISLSISVHSILIQTISTIPLNWSIAIATCISTISTSILLIASVVMYREFELSASHNKLK